MAAHAIHESMTGMQMPILRLSRVLILSLLAITSACASAQKRFEQGQELEAAGRYVEAVNRYVESLEKEPDQPDVIARLEEAGDLAIRDLLMQSDEFHANGQLLPAADAVRSVDRVLARAARVRVALPLRSGYSDLRRSRFDDAISHVWERGDAAFAEQRWGPAIDAYATTRRYDPSAEQLRTSREAIFDVHMGSAHYSMDQEHFRAAAGAAHLAEEVATNLDRGRSEAAIQLQATAIDAGTVTVAFFPFGADGGTYDPPPLELLGEIDDELMLEHWTAPHPFIVAIDPIFLQRELRRFGSRNRVIDEALTRRIGDLLGADLVLTPSYGEFEVVEHDVVARTVQVRGKNGRTESYRHFRGEVDYSLDVNWELRTVRNGRRLGSGSFSVRQRGPYEYGEYGGNLNDLELSRSQRDLLNGELERRLESEAFRDLSERIASRLARQALNRILSTIP